MNLLIRVGSGSSHLTDVQAHLGKCPFGEHCRPGPTGKVFAFEPSPENCARLHHNLEINSIQNVQIVSFAASDSAGVSRLSENGSMTKLGVGSVEINTMTLDQFCTNHLRPDFMLIDVEGHARAVLRGASGVYNGHFVPVIGELHDEKELGEFRSFMYGKSSNLKSLNRNPHMPRHILASKCLTRN